MAEQEAAACGSCCKEKKKSNTPGCDPTVIIHLMAKKTWSHLFKEAAAPCEEEVCWAPAGKEISSCLSLSQKLHLV